MAVFVMVILLLTRSSLENLNTERSPLAGEVVKRDQVRVPQLQSRRSSRKVLFRLAPGIYFPQFFLYIEPCLNWNFLQEQPENGTENVLLCFGNKFQERLVLIHRRK